MSVTIGSNIVSLRAQRELSKSGDRAMKVYERLSSGLRINKASDDAAGLAIADSLKADSRTFTQAIRNANDGLSMLSIAEGAISSLSDIITRITELAEQSANGVYSTKQRSALSTEADKLKDEYNRIVASTTFNGRRILTESQDVQLQVGKDSQATSRLTVSTNLTSSVVGDGTFQAESVKTFAGFSSGLIAADVNGDGKLDMIGNNSGGANNISVALGNGDATFKAALTFQAGTSLSYYPEFRVGDLNGDGLPDIIVDGTYDNSIHLLLGNGNGTFKSQTSYIYKPFAGVETNLQLELTDFNNDGKLDFAVMNGESPQSVGVFLGNGNGTFQAAISTTTDVYNMDTGDVNGDGIMDLVASQYYTNTSRVLLGNGNGTFSLAPTFATPGGSRGVNVIDMNGDGKLDMVTVGSTKFNVAFGNGDGTFKAGVSYASNGSGSGFTRLNVGDLNGDGAPDVIIADTTSGGSVDVYLNNGLGSFSTSRTYASAVLVTSAGGAIALGDYNGDGAIDIAAGGDTINGFGIFLGNTISSATIADIDISTQSQARSALDVARTISANVSNALGKIGAYQSRLQFTVANLSSLAENSQAAESRIRDADVAEESAELVRLGILQQAGVAVLAQANIQPSLALRLLGGLK